ncbi:uncharacterized protein B0H18DRAFT_1021086 [Fomitopsis serialis]|uniref:uncharacterized protein n=1 Tax=Fomitopsis serialis TaxID=139415 RepID=UPI0020083F1C|nr:uncharacterized protein B0H18DRAFT_1021086 [Neoantrodia serialis]KAH9921439.1 hypothetical protein B0H18DRAFT_1021086 [Neoantrodia serialis]
MSSAACWDGPVRFDVFVEVVGDRIRRLRALDHFPPQHYGHRRVYYSQQARYVPCWACSGNTLEGDCCRHEVDALTEVSHFGTHVPRPLRYRPPSALASHTTSPSRKGS